MNKKILIVILCLSSLLIIGCFDKTKEKDNTGKIYLTDIYYNKGNFIKIKNSDISNFKDKTYILYTYNNYCTLPVSCEGIFQKFMDKYKIDFLSIPFGEFKETEFYNTVKYAPSIIIVKNGSIVSFLDANSDDDLEKYQDVDKFEEWLNNYIHFSN